MFCGFYPCSYEMEISIRDRVLFAVSKETEERVTDQQYALNAYH